MSFESLPRGEPESLGVSSRAVEDFARAASERAAGLHGFMLLRRGVVAAEGAWAPFRLGFPHQLYSLSKSFASTAVGLLVEEGKLSVEDSLLSLFPEAAPKTVSPNLSAMKVKHLLTMTTGHAEDSTGRVVPERDPAKAFLALPVEREPGSTFVYNSGATFMLSAIVQKLSGKRLSAYLGPRLFDRIGIGGARWDRHPRGIDFGGWGLSVKLEDIARFGQLYLQKGLWRGERVVPEAWVDEATSKQVDNSTSQAPGTPPDWLQGYGYQFWRCRHGFYRGDGAFGQLCVVMPELDAVFVAFSGSPDIQAILDLVWDILVPGISKVESLPADPAAAKELAGTLAGLGMAPPAPADPSRAARPPVSAVRRKYRFGENWAGLDFLSFDFGPDRLRLGYRIRRHASKGNGLDGPLGFYRASGRTSIEIGYGAWIDGVSWLDGEGPKPASASGAWTSEDTFTAKIFMNRTPRVLALAFRFAGDTVTVSASLNVNMGPTSFPPLAGSSR